MYGFAGCRHQGVGDGAADGARGRGGEVFHLSIEEEEVKSLICPPRKSSVCHSLPFLCDGDLPCYVI